MASLSTHPSVAVGPVMPGWGSWDWVGTFFIEHLTGPFHTTTFNRWDVPNADVVVVVKHAPPNDWVETVSRRSSIIYCPIDAYGDAAEIDADGGWLKKCAKVVVHSRRLESHFAYFADTSFLDHPLKYATPTRKHFRAEGSILWVGVRSNIPPLVAWVNTHPLPASLDVLTNPERPGQMPLPIEFGFRADCQVRLHEWSPERHLQFTSTARVALDIKGEDFRSRHKPPAKALDFIASGLPIALNPGSSPTEHLADLGLRVPSPRDAERWLSEDYWKETRRVGERLTRELAPERVASRFRKVIEAALASRSVSLATRPEARPVAVPVSSVPEPLPPPTAIARSSPRVYGLMITKDDHTVFENWCRDQLELYDSVVCLDGSEGDDTARIASAFADRLVYLRERDFTIPHKTDHGLRNVVHREIVSRFGHGHWVMCCHPDEFCYHDPRKIATAAERDGYDQVSWLSPHFYPHPNELPDWEKRRHLPIMDRHEYYHWSYHGDGFPWCEDRLYRDSSSVSWDGQTHGNVRPNGLSRLAPFHPILRHYKVLVTDPAFYDTSQTAAHYHTHWIGASARTGVPFPVRRLEDLFVRTVSNYTRCDRFAGTFPHPWNMGEEYRPDQRGEKSEDRYEIARTLALEGQYHEARTAYEALLRGEGTGRLVAMIQNDLGVLDAIAGREPEALGRLVTALAADPTWPIARQNIELLSAPVSLPVQQSRTRVAVVSLLFNWPSTGGGNVHTAELTKFLASAGYDVRHFYAQFDPWGLGQVTAPTPYPTEPIVFTEAEWTAGGITDKFRRAIDGYDPHWVILTDSWNLKPVLAAAANGRPYILRLQALECLCPLNNVRLLPGRGGVPRQCSRHQLATPDECARCVRELEHTSGDLHRAERAVAGFGTPEYRETLFKAFAEAAVVLAVNPLIAAMVEPHARDVRVVTAGMDPDRFPWPFPKERLITRTPDRLRIVFAGLTNEWMKGFHILHDACELLWQRRQDFEVVITDDQQKSPGRPWIRYVGWQSQTDLPGHLAAADVVVVPTVAQEALGRTAVEAMAAGKPVVASRIGGLPFTVAEGATGLLCEPGDPNDLANKLARLLDDRELRDRLGTEGRRRFEDRYSWPAIIERHYRPLLGDPLRTPEGKR